MGSESSNDEQRTAAGSPPSAEHLEHPHDVPMPFWEHIRELRRRLIWALFGLLPGIVVAALLSEYLLDFLVQPMASALRELGYPSELNLPGPADLLIAYMRISVIGGVIFSSPWLAYQAWCFVAPALYAREKLYAVPFAVASAVFFAGGALFGQTMVFPMALKMMVAISERLPWSKLLVKPTIMLGDYLGLATQMLIAFGIVFEVPVVVSFLARIGAVNWAQLMRFGRYWVAVSAILAAVLTPSTDVGSQLMLMLPLIVLYYAGVGVAYLIGPPVEASASVHAK